MTEKVRVGIIGTSWWTDLMFLPSFKSHPLADVTAICGRNRERAEEMANKYKIPHVYTDYRKLIERGNLDAVAVVTPDDLHYQMTMDALDANLHVLCEKPMALSTQQAKEMYEKAEAKGVKHMILFTFRWRPHFRYLKQLVDEGYIGRCYHADFDFLADYARQPEYLWRFDGLRSNGVVSDLGSHMIDFARWYVGDIAGVSAQLDAFVVRPSIDNKPLIPANDTALVNLQFDNGAQGMIRVSAVANRGDRGFEIGIRLCGDSGTLEVKQIFLGVEASVKFRGVRNGEEQFRDLEIPDVFYENMDRGEWFGPYIKQSAGPRLFVEAIVKDRPIVPNFYDGLKAQEVVDSALDSNRKRCWINLA